MSTRGTTLLGWHNGALEPLETRKALDSCHPAQTAILAADSWLVVDGRARALELHRERFFAAVERQLPGTGTRLGISSFWAAALATIPRLGAQFPRVELVQFPGVPQLVASQRPAPKLDLTVTVATHLGPDPRSQPTIKGPDTHSLLQARRQAQQRGATEAIILSPEGFIAEGASSALVWWRGDALCFPSPELARVDSVTAKSLITLAGALGVDVYHESVTPEALDGLELWALSALHGIRIVTGWVDGPQPAEEPGRLAVWRSLLDRLRMPLEPVTPR